MGNKVIKLTEQELQNIITESVKKVIKEGAFDNVANWGRRTFNHQGVKENANAIWQVYVKYANMFKQYASQMDAQQSQKAQQYVMKIKEQYEQAKNGAKVTVNATTTWTRPLDRMFGYMNDVASAARAKQNQQSSGYNQFDAMNKRRQGSYDSYYKNDFADFGNGDAFRA